MIRVQSLALRVFRVLMYEFRSRENDCATHHNARSVRDTTLVCRPSPLQCWRLLAWFHDLPHSIQVFDETAKNWLRIRRQALSPCIALRHYGLYRRYLCIRPPVACRQGFLRNASQSHSRQLRSWSRTHRRWRPIWRLPMS